MDIQFKKILSLFFAALSICICVICTSCSDIMPELQITYPRVVYLYNSEDTEPDAVLSVFSEVHSEAVRLSSMTVQHKASGLCWYVKPVDILKGVDKKEYAGCCNLKMPEGEQFPEGVYTIIFTDYAGNTSISNFTLDDSVLEKMPDKATVNKKFIVFDEDRSVLYITADSNDSSDTVEQLSKKYPEGQTVREYISDVRKKAVYVLPEESLRNADE